MLSQTQDESLSLPSSSANEQVGLDHNVGSQGHFLEEVMLQLSPEDKQESARVKWRKGQSEESGN